MGRRHFRSAGHCVFLKANANLTGMFERLKELLFGNRPRQKRSSDDGDVSHSQSWTSDTGSSNLDLFQTTPTDDSVPECETGTDFDPGTCDSGFDGGGGDSGGGGASGDY